MASRPDVSVISATSGPTRAASPDRWPCASEPVEDFREARSRRWFRAGVIRNNEPGLLIIEEAQPRGGQRTRDIVVVSLGATRCVMGIEIKPGAPPLRSGDTVHPYAKTMDWGVVQPAKAAIGKAGKTAKRA